MKKKQTRNLSIISSSNIETGDLLTINKDGAVIGTAANGDMGTGYVKVPYYEDSVIHVKTLMRKCQGNIDKYKKPIIKELLKITKKDNFKAVKLYDMLRKKNWKGFHKEIKRFEKLDDNTSFQLQVLCKDSGGTGYRSIHGVDI